MDFEKMKKITCFGICSILIGLVLSSGQVTADVIKFDNFVYPDGSLVPNGGWANHSGTAGDLQVVNEQVVVQHGTPSEDANLGFAAVAGNIYYGLDFSVSATGQILGTDNEYFAHFRNAFDFSARLDVVPALGGGDYTVGIASDDSVADAIWATDLTFETTYRAVVRYDQDANIAELWIDAALSTDTSILGDDQADPGDSVNSFALRQSDSDLNETVIVDNLVVGTTFEDVVSGVVIPEPASGIVLLVFATCLFVRRRR
ncbi:hypothetical protein N9242_01155 [Vicingaceae bacterium]|nr:hypothetical protein [Vicingaceae bacterium]